MASVLAGSKVSSVWVLTSPLLTHFSPRLAMILNVKKMVKALETTETQLTMRAILAGSAKANVEKKAPMS